LQGYQKNGVFPQYYERLKHLKIGIKPLNDDKGNFSKNMVKYNNGTGFASNEAGGNLIITEQILIKPAYRCYVLLNLENEDEKALYDNIMSYKAEFLPYMGKNDFSLWWTDATEHNFISDVKFSSKYKIDSVFLKNTAVSNFIIDMEPEMDFSFNDDELPWVCFERLPIGFDEKLYQYVYGDFVYSNATFKKEMNMSGNGTFYKIDDDLIIQLF